MVRAGIDSGPFSRFERYSRASRDGEGAAPVVTDAPARGGSINVPLPGARGASLIYRDFVMPSRLGAFAALLEHALEAGYEPVSVEAYWERIKRRAADGDARVLVLRHDIDTDPGTAARMWRLEQSLGIAGSYYFRLATLDSDLMQAIQSAGGHASYHYEEVASLAKRERIHDPEVALARLPEARAMFRRNLDRLRELTRLPMAVVASHGDFVNRKLGVANSVILEDRAFRTEMGVDLEVYDEAFMRHVTARHADGLPPEFWRSGDPTVAIDRGEPVVYLLVHPRNWHADRGVNLRDDARRLREGIRYAVAISGARRRPRPITADRPGEGVRTAGLPPGVSVGAGANIGEHVVLGVPPGSDPPGTHALRIGHNATIRSHTVIYGGTVIGDDFHAGHGALIRESTVIGDHVSVGSHAVVEHHVTIGDRVRIHSGAFVPEFSVLDDGSWIGPNAVLTNARYPLSPNAKTELAGVHVHADAKVGANATLLPGIEIGRNALVGAGSVVTRHVPEDSIVIGNPARVVGSVRNVPAYGVASEPSRSPEPPPSPEPEPKPSPRRSTVARPAR
jgi:acetyltransferase-like isoleucine patch superfamily enzyme